MDMKILTLTLSLTHPSPIVIATSPSSAFFFFLSSPPSTHWLFPVGRPACTPVPEGAMALPTYLTGQEEGNSLSIFLWHAWA